MNKVIIGMSILLLFNLLGELVTTYLIPILPGSIIGMVLLFIALQTKIIKEDWVKSVVEIIMKNLPILFLAPAVGVITVSDLIKGNMVAILFAIIVSAMCVLLSVGLTLNKWAKDEQDSTK